MFRRCISILVIAGLLASQLAALPHAHGAMSPEEQQKHAETPHFHCGCLGHGHPHTGHAYSRAGHKKSSPDKADEALALPVESGFNVDQHDEDAIYLSGQSVPALIGKGHGLTSACLFSALALNCTCEGDFQLRPITSGRWHPSDVVLDASDSYLTLRNLRI